MEYDTAKGGAGSSATDPAGSGAWEFWIDRGGTFTDVVARRPDGSLDTLKLLSEAPELYPDAAIEGIRRCLGLEPGSDIPEGRIGAVKMGTTVATNALLERKGAATLLVTTKGFADLARVGLQARPKLFARAVVKPEPLHAEVIEARERLDAEGQVLSPLEEEALRRALVAARARGLTSVAIAFLHAHRNPVHEKVAARLARAAGFREVALSHEVSQLAKILGRADTTVADAYLSPILRGYVEAVAGALDLGRATGSLAFMQSNGGLTDAGRFRGKDAILSGPAGGIVGMAKTGLAAGFDRLIGFDMGGTSTDVSHFNGAYERSFEAEVAGVRLRAPMMDIHTVAAGGGSICRFGDGRYQVGPESAGAQPGPASYGRGGPLTVTDCNVMLGRLAPAHFPALFGPGGNRPLDAAAARAGFEALAQAQAAATGRPALPPEEVAEGFLRVAVENMAAAIKKISVARGHDISGYTLQCFGGAGGQHACRVAEALGMRRILLHPFAGVLSAFGMGLAEVRALREKTFEAPLDEVEAAARNVAALAVEAEAEVRRQSAGPIETEVQAFLRYDGAHQALAVRFDTAEAMQAAFEAAHRAWFGFASPERAVLFEALAVEARSASVPVPPLTPPATRAEAGPPRPMATTDVFVAGGWRPVSVFNRDDLGAGAQIAGPAILREATGTTIVEPGWRARVDAQANLILEQVGEMATQAPAAPAGDAADPVLLEVFNSRFMSIAEQMGATLAKTSWSVNIKERLDFSCAIFDVAGDLVANAPHVPVHLGSMSDAVRKVIAATAATAEPGDAFMLNSPFDGGTHLPDVTVVSPVFAGGEIAFWLGSRGHHADIGGRTPGSSPPDSTRIEEEGVVIALAPLVREGRFLEPEARALLACGPYPARNPDQNIADLKAQVAANETGRRGLSALIAEQGLDRVRAYMRHVQDNAAASVEAVIDGLDDGSFVLPMDHGAEIHVALRIDRARRRAVVDFTGTSAQHAGNFNAPRAISRAVVLYVFRTLVGSEIPLNEGCLRPIDIVVPEGTLLNPRPPAAVIAGNTEVSQAACNALFGALGVMAASQGTMNNFIWGNARFQNYETLGGGTGAGPGFAGADAVQSHMTNTRMTDPEILEARFPVRIEEVSIRRGSGGAGRWRGGDGMVRRLRFLEPVTVTTLALSRAIAPFGLAGGGSGALGQSFVEWPDGRREEVAGNVEVTLPAGAVFEIRTPGGGGWGAA